MGSVSLTKTPSSYLYNNNLIFLEYCYVSKDVGIGLSRVIKSKAKRGLIMKIAIKGCSGDGISKCISMIKLSKFVFSEFDYETNVLTVQKL